MCGRLTLKTAPAEWGQLLLPALDFEALSTAWQPRFNIAPTQDIVVIARGSGNTSAGGEGSAALQFAKFRWGLVPSWSADLSIGNRMINARHETLREKKSFIGPLRQRRCLIVADGYYEWQVLGGKHKQPHWISPMSGGLIQLAGLWETNKRATGQPFNTCTIITTAANQKLSEIHDRMPVVLNAVAAERWMDLNCEVDEAYAQLGPAPNEILTARPVSSYVNNARHEGNECLTIATPSLLTDR